MRDKCNVLPYKANLMHAGPQFRSINADQTQNNVYIFYTNHYYVGQDEQQIYENNLF